MWGQTELSKSALILYSTLWYGTVPIKSSYGDESEITGAISQDRQGDTGRVVSRYLFGLFTGDRNDMIAAETVNPKTDTIPLTRGTTPSGKPVVSYTPREDNNITAAYRDYVQDTLAPTLKIKASDINDPDGRVKELLQINASVFGQLTAAKVEIDSLKRMVTYYQGRYFTATTRVDTTGRSTLTYEYNVKLNMVTGQKRTFFNDYLVTHITSPNSNMVVNHVEHFRRVTPIKPRRFGAGIQAGWHYVPSSRVFTPTVGVGVSYNFFRLP